MEHFREWKHIFKLDPNKEISDDALEKICESGTDAVMIGGTDGVTEEKVVNLMARVRRYSVPCVLEISDMDAVAPGFDLYFIPSVLNSRRKKWLIDAHVEAVKKYGPLINWDEIVMEGYCILNPDSKAAALTEAAADLSLDDLLAYAQVAEKMFHFPVFYLEYSGTYGDPETVAKVKSALSDTVLFYGGGIRTPEQAEAMARHADCIVVGNSLYTDLENALKTVKAAKGAK